MGKNLIVEYKKIFMYIALCIPACYIFFNSSYLEEALTIWIPIAAAVPGAVLFFMDYFVDKDELIDSRDFSLGPDESFIPPESTQWEQEIDPLTGIPTPRRVVVPPRQYRR